MSSISWVEEIENIKTQIQNGKSLEEIGYYYGVSKQRIYQILTKFGIPTLIKERKNFLRDREPKFYWFNKMLVIKGVQKNDRLELLNSMNVPDYCPILGIKLNYDGIGVGKSGWTRSDDSPSLDRIDPSKGYVKGNIHIISWRANRIKNDSTPEEIMKIALYIQNLT